MDEFDLPKVKNPLDLQNDDSDLTIIWKGTPNAFVHPQYGLIGPIPFRRTGGHTGPYGVSFISGSSIHKGYHGIRSSLDVVPTIADLLNSPLNKQISGSSLFQN